MLDLSGTTWAALGVVVTIGFGLGSLVTWWLSHRHDRRALAATIRATEFVEQQANYESERRMRRRIAGANVQYTVRGGRPRDGSDETSGIIKLQFLNWHGDEDIVVVDAGMSVVAPNLGDSTLTDLERDLRGDLRPHGRLVVLKGKDVQFPVVNRDGTPAALTHIASHLHAAGAIEGDLYAWAKDDEGTRFEQPPVHYRIEPRWMERV